MVIRVGSSPILHTKVDRGRAAVFFTFVRDLNMEPFCFAKRFCPQKRTVRWTVRRVGRTGESPILHTKVDRGRAAVFFYVRMGLECFFSVEKKIVRFSCFP